MKLAVIPARGGSKRIPKKNSRLFLGKPMIAWAIEAAKASFLFDEVWVSTDDENIASIAKDYGAKVPFIRPDHLADDYATTIAVMHHAVEWANEHNHTLDAVCCLYATAPLLDSDDLLTSFKIFESKDWDYVFSATEFPSSIFRAFYSVESKADAENENTGSGVELFFPEHRNTRSQDLPTALHDAAMFYWGKPEAWLCSKDIFSKSSKAFVLPKWRVCDIDTLEDWVQAEILARCIIEKKGKSEMNIAFRVDATSQMGTGHVMRCLSLANIIKSQGGNACFVSRFLTKEITSRLFNEGHELILLPETESDNEVSEWLGVNQLSDAYATQSALMGRSWHWLIVDHYGIDKTWESILSTDINHIMVIDDLMNRPHYCHVLLDQTYKRNAENYKKFVPSDCKILTGSHYALLRPEFIRYRPISLSHRKMSGVKKLLVNLGGSDPANVTLKVIDCLRQVKITNLEQVTVVTTSSFPSLDTVKNAIDNFPYSIELLVDVNNMAELMANNDWMIGAAGTSSWERCCLGLPSIAIIIADNQKDTAYALAADNAIRLIDDVNAIDKQLPILMQLLADDVQYLNDMSIAARGVTQGYGCELVLQQLKEFDQCVSV